jgi:tRNA(Ile2) C34 agmatinyltransferase TiaS
MKRKSEGKCPYCGGRIEHFPDQDGSCDCQCSRCGWHEHIPSQAEIAQARAENRPKPKKGGD